MKLVKTKKNELTSIITAASVGTIIEWYDFFIFGSLATIISSEFFPKEHPTAAFLATLATYAAGLVVRPFGALVFGRLGDLVGRKYTFMVTLLLMGGSTFAIGLIPTYDTIGFWAPLTVLILRLLQGLAIGGEYGGAATFVAEHAPAGRRGFWTSWIQATSIAAFILSLAVIIIVKGVMDVSSWNEWGWRVPFLLSAFMVVISYYIRKNMAESPLFAKAKAEGKTSKNPLRESLGKRENLKMVLLALFGVVMGIGAASWASVLYVQTFFIKFMNLDYDQANAIVVTALIMGGGFNIIFGSLSDKFGRKRMIMLSLFLGIVCFRPAYRIMYPMTNVQNKIEQATSLITAQNAGATTLSVGDSVSTTVIKHVFRDGTIATDTRKESRKKVRTDNVEVSTSVKLSLSDEWLLILIVFVLEVITTIGYGPLAAFLVELFPLKIRYTSLSLPYHIGFGIFGGMCPVIATYLIEKSAAAKTPHYYLAGLNYPILLMVISLIIGLLYLKDSGKSKRNPLIPDQILNPVKKYAGIVWMVLGVAAAWFGIEKLGWPRITSGNQDDLIFGIIILFIITPIASIGLFVFGKYALQGEYDERPGK